MGFIDDELAKYERRIKKLSEHPDPRQLQSTAIVYEMWRDQRIEELRAWRAGEPFLYYFHNFHRLGLAMGFHIWHVSRNADRAQSNARHYLANADNYGFPDMICDRVRTGVGLALSGEIPPPSLVVGVRAECSPQTEELKAIGRHFGCPMIILSGGVLSADEESLRYVTDQMRQFVSFAEASVPGVKLDMDKFVELQTIQEELDEIRTRMAKSAAQVPAPVSGRDSFRLPPFELTTHPRFLEYARAYEAEINAKVQAGTAAVPNEQLRAMWLTSAPFYDDPFKFLAERGMSTPLYEESIFFPGRTPTWKDWETHFGRRLDPLEREAVTFLQGAWRNRVEVNLKACGEFKIDALIHFQLAGCPTCLGSAALLAERARDELGIPSLMIEGWCMDEDKYDKEQFEARLAEFVDVCKARKGLA